MRALADTSLFIAFEADRELADEPPDEIAVSVVTVGELRLGVLMAADTVARQRRLTTLQFAGGLDPLPIDDAVVSAWAGLIAALRAEGKQMRLNDSWIAATAIANGMPVATQDTDFDGAPGLDVIRL